jgi:ketosteroid isomerase-like protein
MVIIRFDAAATTKDGQPYCSTYTWYFQMAEGRALSIIAFLDTREFDEFWARVLRQRDATKVDAKPGRVD